MSATEVETAQLQSGIISSDIVTSMAASLFAENSSASTDFMNNKTSVTVSDTNAESFECASTTAGILTTEYGATKSNTVSINGGISLNYTVTTPLFYTTDHLSDMEVEASVLQSSFISSDLDTSMSTLNIAEESIASTDIISIETVVSQWYNCCIIWICSNNCWHFTNIVWFYFRTFSYLSINKCPCHDLFWNELYTYRYKVLYIECRVVLFTHRHTWIVLWFRLWYKCHIG